MEYNECDISLDSHVELGREKPKMIISFAWIKFVSI